MAKMNHDSGNNVKCWEKPACSRFMPAFLSRTVTVWHHSNPKNMALNSYITEEGLEMGRAQVMQAEAAGIKPQVCMNPILLKPTNDTGSQVIVNGEVLKNMKARIILRIKRN